MDITVNSADGLPIYRQIANQVRYMVASGILRAGDEITPVRTLALQLKITPNTVVKAYAELEADGLIYKRRGAGTYISEIRSRLADAERVDIIEQRIDKVLAEAHQLNLSPEQVLSIFRKRQAEMLKKFNGDKTNDKDCG